MIDNIYKYRLLGLEEVRFGEFIILYGESLRLYHKEEMVYSKVQIYNYDGKIMYRDMDRVHILKLSGNVFNMIIYRKNNTKEAEYYIIGDYIVNVGAILCGYDTKGKIVNIVCKSSGVSFMVAMGKYSNRDLYVLDVCGNVFMYKDVNLLSFRGKAYELQTESGKVKVKVGKNGLQEEYDVENGRSKLDIVKELGRKNLNNDKRYIRRIKD